MIFQSFRFSCSSSGTQPRWSASGSNYPDRDRAACAVGAEETGHVAGAGGGGETVDGGGRAAALGEGLYFDHLWHARSGRLGAACVTVSAVRSWLWALLCAFGLADERVREGCLVGRGVLSLVAELAEDRPVLVLADDAQWVDRASADALVFAARRLQAERAAVLVAARDQPPGVGLPGLPELPVGRLDQTAPEHLLAGPGPA